MFIDILLASLLHIPKKNILQYNKIKTNCVSIDNVIFSGPTICVLIHSTNYGLGEKLFYACVKLSFQNRTVSFSVFSKKIIVWSQEQYSAVQIGDLSIFKMDVDTIFFSCNVFFFFQNSRLYDLCICRRVWWEKKFYW